MDQTLMVKQFLGVMRGRYATFNVYNSGVQGYVVLRPLMPGYETSGIEGGLEFARKRTDFKRGVLPRG